LAHKKTWDAWPEDVRNAVQAALAEATPAQRGFAAAEDEAIKSRMDPGQNELIELSEDERAAFVSAVAPVVERTMSQFRDELFEYLPRG